MDNKVTVYCKDCGKPFEVTFDYFRRKNKDYYWRCKECMKLYRSKMQKNSNTNIGNIVKKKLQDPVYGEVYRQQMRERGLQSWNNRNEEDKKEAKERASKIWSNLTKDQRDKLIDKVTENLNQYRSNITPEQRENHNMHISEARKQYFKNMTVDDHEAYKQIYVDAWNKKDEASKEIVKDKSRNQWNNYTEDKKQSQKELLKNNNENRWKLPENHLKASVKSKERWESLSEEEKEAFLKYARDQWNYITDDEKYRRLKMTFSKSNGNNKLHQKFESYFYSSYISDSYYIKPEIVTNNNLVTHSWDYGIYDKENNNLKMVVDLDGSYFHADNCDYDGLHSKEEYDERRVLSIPENMRFCFIYENNFSRSFEEMIKLLMDNYDTFIENQFKICRSMPFPYPHYTDIELIKSWNQLLHMDCNDKYHKDISLNTRIGDRLIQHFHHSIWHAHTKKSISPYEAWYNDELLMKSIKNRIIYQPRLNHNKILQGFNICKIATKVSVFSAARAKMIINKYLSDYDTIFDPFSGFSGRMLGTISLGKKYIGQDISLDHINESNDIIKFLKKYGIDVNVNMIQNDILLSYGTYDCLFTCPPYSDKEQWKDVPVSMNTCDDWIDICLSHFKCKTYLFVVDSTEKYKDHIVDTITNKSHFGKNSEYIIKI